MKPSTWKLETDTNSPDQKGQNGPKNHGNHDLIVVEYVEIKCRLVHLLRSVGGALGTKKRGIECWSCVGREIWRDDGRSSYQGTWGRYLPGGHQQYFH